LESLGFELIRGSLELVDERLEILLSGVGLRSTLFVESRKEIILPTAPCHLTLMNMSSVMNSGGSG
jgi:hypothetical protein